MQFLFVLFALAGTAAEDEVTPPGIAFSSVGFEQIASEDGVTVYRDPDAPVIRIGAEATFAAPPEVVADVLLDYDCQAGRIGRLSEVVILERQESSLLVYERLNLPIISDRDFNLRVTWSVQNGRRFIRWHAVDGEGVPPKDGVVRVLEHTGSWTLTPIADGRFTKARFQTRLDFAGWVPRWLVRPKAGKEMPGFFRELRGLIAARAFGGGVSCK